MMNTQKSIHVKQSWSIAAVGSNILSVCATMFRCSGKLAYFSVALFGISPLLPVIILMYAFKFLDESCQVH